MFRFCAAVLIPLVIVAGLELGLRLFGYGYPTTFFRQIKIDGQDYYVTNDKFGYRFFPPALARTPAPQRLAVKKSPHAYRIFVFGESAALGDPEPGYGAWRYLQILLHERFPGTDFEVVCVAMTAVNSHALLPMARECARLDGDLWILYLGNNEMVGPFGAGTVFGSRAPGTGLVRTVLAIKSTRIGQLLDALRLRWGAPSSTPDTWGGLSMFEDHQLRPDDPNRLRAYENFKKNLTDILHSGHAAGVPVILSTVGSNLKNCAPFASLPEPGLGETQKAKWDAAYQAGIALEAAGDYPAALKQYAGAAAIDPRYADLQFRLGTCHLARTNPVPALGEFELARDYDTLAFRADSRINQIIKDAADAGAGQGVYFLDAARLLAQNSREKIPGNEMFYEHVHLNFDGNYLLGRALAEQVANLLPPAIASRGGKGWAPADLCDRRLAVSPWDRSRVWEEIINRLAEPPYSGQLTHAGTVRLCEEKIGALNAAADAGTPEATRQLYRQALALAPADIFLHQNFAQFLGASGDLAQATVEAQRVAELLPQRPAQYYDIGNLLIIQGRIDEAVDYYSRALAVQGDFAHALNGMGLVLANRQKTSEAAAYFQRSLRANPVDPETCLDLGFMEQNRGDIKQALDNYQKAARLQPQGLANLFYQAVESSALGFRDRAVETLGTIVQLEPAYWPAHYLLGLELAALGKMADARAQFMAACRYRPDFAPAHLNLGMALVQLGQIEAAEQQFEETLRLDPASSKAADYLHQTRGLKPAQ